MEDLSRRNCVPVDAARRVGICNRCGIKLIESTDIGTCNNCRATQVEGVGKDAPVTTNANGGKQSHSPFRCDLLPPQAVLAVAKILEHGAGKYGEKNWHKISVSDNLNHALVHMFAYLVGDTQDDHLEHAATRILFALDQKLSGRGEA